MWNGNKFGALVLCVASLLLLASLGKLDLLVILLPVSGLLSLRFVRGQRNKNHADRPHTKGIA